MLPDCSLRKRSNLHRGGDNRPCPSIIMLGSRKHLIRFLGAGLLLCWFVFLSGCISAPRSMTATPIPTFTPLPTSTPTATFTVTPTPTRTRTPNPTETLTPAPSRTTTPTLSPPPTLTAAVPFFESNRYELAVWGPARAARLINLMENFPNAIYKDFRGEAYYRAYRYAALVEREAVLRFPDIEETTRWRWMAAYNLARAGDPQAGASYAELLEDALLNGDTDLDNLNLWFAGNELADGPTAR